MSNPSLTVAPEPFDSTDSRRLIAALDAELGALYPPEQRFGPNFKAEQIEGGRGTFLIARHGGRAVACGAIRRLDETTAEVKRMYSEPSVRGTGVGRAVLESLESALRDSLRPVLTVDRDYVDAFDRFEYLAALVRADYELQHGHSGWAPIGCFGWRQRIMKVIDREIQNQGTEWPAIKLFGGTSLDRLDASRKVVKGVIPGSWGW